MGGIVPQPYGLSSEGRIGKAASKLCHIRHAFSSACGDDVAHSLDGAGVGLCSRKEARCLQWLQVLASAKSSKLALPRLTVSMD